MGAGAFNLPTYNPNPHGSTPKTALDATLAHGSVFGAVPPSRAPRDAGYPSIGWHPAEAGTGTAVLQSGKAELDFTQVSDGSWVLTGGHPC